MSKNMLLIGLVVMSVVVTSKAWTYNTNSLFVVIIDGVRNQEVFEDSTHTYAPHIWNDLRPLGTIYTNFYTMVRTGTTPGHQVLVSGNRTDIINNKALLLSPYRSLYPTMFEYFRASSGIPVDSTWIVSGKRNINVCDYSLHPAFGPDYAPSSLTDIGHDTTTYEVLINVLEDYHPRLMLINFKDVDLRGHLGPFEAYTTAIQIADSLVYELYNYLQNDDFYAGNVTLFITTDHGRIDDLNGGFNHHGLGTHGDRNCYFVALGPDIKVGEVVENVRSFIDITPTIGELMGFETPFAEGRVMDQMLIGRPQEVSPASPVTVADSSYYYTNVSNSTTASLFPSVAMTDTIIYVLWSEKDNTSQYENWKILLSHSNDGGQSWSEPVLIFENVQIDGTAYRGEISWAEDAGLFAAVNGYYGFTNELGLRSYNWFVAYSGSTDGVDWTTPAPFLNYTEQWKTIILNPPRVVLDGTGLQVDWVTDSWFTAKESTDGGNSFTTVVDYHKPRLVPNEFFTYHDVTMDSEKVYYVVERNDWHGNGIYCLSYYRNTGILGVIRRIDSDSTGSFRPSLGMGSGTLHVVWSDVIDGFKGVYHRMSLDGGNTFTTPSLISEEGIDAWNPDITVSGDTVIVVWEDYRDGIGEIYSRRSSNRASSWGAVTRESMTNGFSIRPRVDSHNNTFHLAWQDMSSGNWEVYSKPILLQ